MALTTIYTTNLTKYRPVIWYGKAVFRHSTQLRSFLEKQLGDEYKHLFTEPHVSDEALDGLGQAYWLSEYVSSNAKPLSTLSVSEQEKCFEKLSKMLDDIAQLAEKLINSAEKDAMKWGEILQKMIDVPSLDHVFVEGEKIVLACWGFSSDQTEAEQFRLRKIMSPPPAEVPEGIVLEEPAPEATASIVEEPVVREPEIKIEEKPVEVVPPIKIEEKKEDEKPKKSWLKWLAILLGLLLLIAIIIIIVLSLSHDKAPLPDQEGKIPPIDEDNIVKDTIGRDVISNQLIVWITNDGATIDNFAKDFKGKFTDAVYKIVYYNNQFKRVVIEFPADQKQYLKDNLEKQIPGYNLIILDETIFKMDSKPVDPGFSDIKMSWGYEAIKAYDAWNKNMGSPDIIVAIIDDGFDLNHEELKGRIVNPYNVPLNNQSPNTGSVGMVHGTHVSGTSIGNSDNGEGVSGVAPKCKYMPVQVGDPNGNMSFTAIIDAVLYCVANGADVVNMSLGGPELPGVAEQPLDVQRELIKVLFLEEERLWNEIFAVAEKKGTTVVLAGGNSNYMVGIDAMLRTPYTINVSAIDPQLHRAEFSNYGEYSTVSAPGVQIYSSVPGNNYEFHDGTSMAAPFVTGAVALLKSANPSLTTKDIIRIFDETGLDINEPEKKIGKLIQLDAALNMAGGFDDKVGCPDIQKKIDSLLNEIEKLKGQCPDTTNNEDFIIPDDAKDFEFAMGKWKSTTDLFNTNTKEDVELYFEFFKNGTGILTLIEADGNKCTADLTLSLDKNTLKITQLADAVCEDGGGYEKYTFVCVSHDNEVANCVATNSSDATLLEFNLKRIY